MKKMILLLTIFIISISAQNYNVSKEIKDLMKISQDGWNEGNWDKYMSIYQDSDSTRFVGGGNVTYGFKTIMQRFQKSYSDKSKMGILTFDDIKVKALGENAALVLGKWALKREKDNPWGRYTLVFIKTDKGWKVIHDHSSTAE